MATSRPYVTSEGPRFRRFAAFPVTVQAILVNSDERFLLLLNPAGDQGWQVVSGALEAGETILDGTLREVYEELGPGIRVRPMGTVHLESFHYDSRVRFMLASYYLFLYQGGPIHPGDDMRGSNFRWWSLRELEAEELQFHPSVQVWMLRRAVDLYRLWREEPPPPLQPRI